METLCSVDLQHPMSMTPWSRTTFFRQFLWLIILIQFIVCVLSSVGLSYFFYKTLYNGGVKSWKKARDIMGPIEKRLKNLEKEKVIWNLYLDWMEDYCTVYYGLLNYLNTTVMDLDKLYREHSLTLKNLSEGSDQTSHSDVGTTKAVCSQYGVGSEPSWDGTTSDEDAQLVASFVRVFANMKTRETGKTGSGDVKRDGEFPSSLSLDMTSTNGTNEESGRDEQESLLQTSDDENKFSEIKILPNAVR